MKVTFFLALSFSLISSQVFAKNKQGKITTISQFVRVEAEPSQGFNFPFFLYIPETTDEEQNLLVLPNNSTLISNDVELQAESAKEEALVWRDLSDSLSAVLLVPAFPRPEITPAIYTHALSRSTLEIKEGSLKRIDLQLIKMTERAREVVKKVSKKRLRKKLLLFGFSASAMFVNRFAFIHPDLVSAVAFGAPGGWPLAPIKEFNKKPLRYPIGISDLDGLVGSAINLESIKQIPFFMFLGSKDENDSVVFRDGYDVADEELVFALFGKKPVDRWPIAEKIYKDTGLNAQFKLYEGIGHGTNKAIREDVVKFFLNIKNY